MTEFPASQSEDNGIRLLTDSDRLVYSVGISTGGVAEIRMARDNPARHIIATTIDKKGAAFAVQRINEAGLSSQIHAKLEDATDSLPYDAGLFDYIYARLVLHYLSRQQLSGALHELNRILRPGGRLFAVVRSVECPDAQRSDAVYDEVTGYTSCTDVAADGQPYSYSRYFHTEKSIGDAISNAGFQIRSVKAYEEQLYTDFMRSELSPHTDHVIEVIAEK